MINLLLVFLMLIIITGGLFVYYHIVYLVEKQKYAEICIKDEIDRYVRIPEDELKDLLQGVYNIKEEEAKKGLLNLLQDKKIGYDKRRGEYTSNILKDMFYS